MAETTVKMDEIGKARLEKLLARLRLDADIKLDQFRLLRFLVEYGDENLNDFISFLQGVKMSEDEIKIIHEKYIQPGIEYTSDKSDDELIYGD